MLGVELIFIERSFFDKFGRQVALQMCRSCDGEETCTSMGVWAPLPPANKVLPPSNLQVSYRCQSSTRLTRFLSLYYTVAEKWCVKLWTKFENRKIGQIWGPISLYAGGMGAQTCPFVHVFLAGIRAAHLQRHLSAKCIEQSRSFDEYQYNSRSTTKLPKIMSLAFLYFLQRAVKKGNKRQKPDFVGSAVL